MKLHIPTIVLAVALTATGCNNNQKEQTTTESATAVTDPNTQNPSDSVANSLTPVAAEAPAQVPAAAAQSPSNAVALNPVHGAPGHRCDIEVGQPLNSPPKAGAQPIQQQAPQPAAPQLTPAPQLAPAPQLPAINNLPTDSKLALNPEHGKPGHRCDIAVGAPLK